MARRRVSRTPTFGDNRERLAQIGKVAARFEKWRPAAEVLRHVESVPTRFCEYDHVLEVGGHPIGRITLVHGPSSEGKTKFVLGLGESFLARDHFFGFVDAERTTFAPWVQSIMRGLSVHPGFVAIAANTYEEVRLEVRRLCEGVANARAKKELPDSTTCLIVIDSIRKLYPKGLWDELMKELGAPEEDGKKRRGRKAQPKAKLSSRAEQMKAAMNARWMDELVPLLADTRSTIAIIAREYTNTEAGLYDPDYVVAGGRSLYFDASVDVRVSRSWVKEGTGEDSRIVGERHNLDIHKTKISGKTVKVPRVHFHSSNGVLVPEGFDEPRDLIELGEQSGLVQVTSNGFYTWQKRRLGQGISNVVRRLHGDAELLEQLRSDVRAFIHQSVKRAEPVASSAG